MDHVDALLSVMLWPTGVPCATHTTIRPLCANNIPLPRPIHQQPTQSRSLQPSNRQPQVITPIDPTQLQQIIRDLPDSSFLIDGFTHGFRVSHSAISIASTHHNHQSAYLQAEFLDHYIHKELSQQRISGPFSTPPHPLFVSSPLGIVPKKEPNSYRVIHDLSFPKGSSVNDLIPNTLTSVQYEDFDFVTNMIVKAGQSAFIANVDIQNTFRIMPIHPLDRHLFGFTWRHQFYYDNCLPMGCSLSCALFERFSSTLQQALQTFYSFSGVSHILDDFIFVGPQGSSQCQLQLQIFLELAHYVGIPIKHTKTINPTHIAPIHGIQINTVSMEASLPLDKLTACREKLTKFSRSRSVRLREWQSLIGTLSFAAKVVRPGRPYIRRFINAIRGCTKPHHHIKLASAIRRDCAMWLNFLSQFNGISIIRACTQVTSLQIHLRTDASGWGYSAIYGDQWFQGHWPPAWQHIHINTKEFFPILLAAHTWGHLWSGHDIKFLCDSQTVVHVINKASTRDRNMLNILRALTLLSLEFDFLITAQHLPGIQNSAADYLSRSQAQTDTLTHFQLRQDMTALDHQLIATVLQSTRY